MGIQLNLFGAVQAPKKEKNRDAKWDKFYSLYMFDEIKYHKLVKSYLNANKLVTYSDIPAEELKRIKNSCYIRDELGQRRPLGDCKHIFRYRTLYKLLAELGAVLTHGVVFQDDVVYYHSFAGCFFKISIDYYKNGNKYVCEKLAEVEGSSDLSIKQRVLLHLKVLRKLRELKN